MKKDKNAISFIFLVHFITQRLYKTRKLFKKISASGKSEMEAYIQQLETGKAKLEKEVK